MEYLCRLMCIPEMLLNVIWPNIMCHELFIRHLLISTQHALKTNTSSVSKILIIKSTEAGN